MDPTTLVTFLFRAPPEVRTVELLGSWDNFHLPYRMHHDRLRGSNFFSGCFKFENIIFDGEEFQWTKPRTGGLKQGGTYWYYYRLNYDLDAYDDRQPYTTGCPLLPGQVLNVMEVPTEVIEIPTRCHSAYGNDIVGSLTKFAQQKTLDPADKYAAVEPPPMSKVHSRCLSDDQLAGRLEGQPRIVVDRPISPISPAKSRLHRPVSPPSRGSLTSVRVRRQGSAVSSMYSQHSSEGVPPTAVSAVSEMSAPIKREQVALQPSKTIDQLPAFEYPMMPSAAPLGSIEALGACLFSGTSDSLPTSDTMHDCQPSSLQRRDSTFSCGPASVQDVQFYGSRPGTSQGEDRETYQPRTYSIPPSNLSGDSPATSPLSPNFPNIERHEYADCILGTSEDDDTPDEDLAALELTSPTLTGTTVSTDGHNTPFRLSAQLSYDERLPGHDTRSFENSTQERAASPRESTSSGRPSLLERGLARLRPSFGLNYSLPSLSSDSNHSLAKTITRISQEETASSAPPLPTIIREEEGSMANAIFSELGFLSASII